MLFIDPTVKGGSKPLTDEGALVSVRVSKHTFVRFVTLIVILKKLKLCSRSESMHWSIRLDEMGRVRGKHWERKENTEGDRQRGFSFFLLSDINQAVVKPMGNVPVLGTDPERCRDTWCPPAAAPAPARRRLGGTAGLRVNRGKQTVFQRACLPSFILILYTNTQLLPDFSTKYDFCWANHIRMDAAGIH